MMDFSQGDIIKISGLKHKFMVISKNAFIRATGVFHVCPVVEGISQGPLHIEVKGKDGTQGIVLCEQIKIIDPAARGCSKVDRVSYSFIMNISDAIQGIFEYD